MSPLVSIICATYNQEKYISQAIEGFLMQKTNFPFEIIVHDDASKDNTASIVKSYEIKYPSLFANIYQTENQYSKGSSNVSKIVFEAARGKYIALCEGDDYWIDPLKLQKQVNFLEENMDYGLVWTDIDFYIQSSGVFNKAVFKNKIIPFHNSFIDVLINASFLAPATWLCKREILPIELNNYCDGTFPMILDILATTKIKYLDEATAVYRQLNESASHNPSSQNRYNRYKGIYKIQKDYLKKYKLSDDIAELIELKHFESVYPYIVIFEDKKTIKKGQDILKKSHSKSMKMHISLLLSNFSLGIYILKTIFKLRDKFHNQK